MTTIRSLSELLKQDFWEGGTDKERGSNRLPSPLQVSANARLRSVGIDKVFPLYIDHKTACRLFNKNTNLDKSIFNTKNKNKTKKQNNRLKYSSKDADLSTYIFKSKVSSLK